MTALLDYESNQIVELMQQSAEFRGADWLKESLQQAILPELASLPPYLCGMWSIEETASDHPVHDALRAIVFDETSHTGIARNLLTTIGGKPRPADVHAVLKYPGPLPGGVRPGPTVFLGGLTKESPDLFGRIEEPDEPLARATSAHTSTGAFHSAILAAFRSHPELITGARQVVGPMTGHGAGSSLVALGTLGAVETAIGVIKEQGERTSSSPLNPHPGVSGDLAHFFVFRQIHHGHELVKVSENPETWDFTKPEIPMPPTHPLGVVPNGGRPREGPSANPDTRTSRHVQPAPQRHGGVPGAGVEAGRTGQATQLLDKAVREMRFLGHPARELLATPLPDGSGDTHGPEFRYVDAQARSAAAGQRGPREGPGGTRRRT